MFKKNWPFILAATIVLGLATYFYLLYLKSPTYNWTPNFNHTSSSPYGNELLYKVIKDIYPEKEFITIEEPLVYNRSFNNAVEKNSIYFFSGYSFMPDPTTISSLYNFINKGNQVFIASNEISQYFLDSLLHHEIIPDEMGKKNALAKVECMQLKPALLHPDLKLLKRPVVKYKVFQAFIPMAAGYFPDDFFEDQSITENEYDYYRIGYFDIGRDKGYTNYIKIKVGEGWLHLYSTPLVFTNYYLRKKEVFDYTQKVFLHLEPGNVYWHVNSYASDESGASETENEKSPFGVLLSFTSFRYAWYSFLGAILLFSIFSFKRRQRPIPVLERNINTSVEFAETITKLYLADGKHKNIAQQKFRYFFNFVRTKFGINLKKNNPDDKKRLSYLSKVPIENIDKIMFNHTHMESLPDTTVEELNESVFLINDFYNKVN